MIIIYIYIILYFSLSLGMYVAVTAISVRYTLTYIRRVRLWFTFCVWMGNKVHGKQHQDITVTNRTTCIRGRVDNWTDITENDLHSE